MKKIIFSVLALAVFSTAINAQIITTIAGNGTAGFSGDGGPATSANLNFPTKVASDAAGNLYFSDNGNNRIRKVDANGIVTTIAGTSVAGFTGDGGLATAAQINFPWGVALDASGNIYFCDGGNHAIRKIDALTGIISTVAGTGGVAGFSGDGGPATSAKLNTPTGLAIDQAGNMYITDDYNVRVRKVDANGIITTFAGNGTGGAGGDGGPATLAQVSFPVGISVDVNGNVYISDGSNSRVRKVDINGIINTIAGNGVWGFGGDGGLAVYSILNRPWDAIADAAGNVYIADFFNYCVRKIDGNTGIISTYAGTPTIKGYSGDSGPATSAKMDAITGLCFDNNGNLIIADGYNNVLRKVDASIIPIPPVAHGPADNTFVGVCDDVYTYPGVTTRISAVGGTNYLWTPNTGLSSNNSPIPDVTINSTTTYVVKITVSPGVFKYDTVTVFINGNPPGPNNFPSCSNWVTNGDVETNSGCNPGFNNQAFIGGVITYGWTNAAFTSADNYNACMGINCSTCVPINCMSGGGSGAVFSASPGNGYMGLILYSNFSQWQEYPQQQLQCPLVQGQRYKVGFSACRATQMNFNCGDLGMWFTNTQPTGGSSISGAPQINVSAPTLTIPWQTYTTSITGSGQSWLTMGNLTSTPSGCTRIGNYAPCGGANDYTYAFLDDIFVTPTPPVINIFPTTNTVCIGLGPIPTFTLNETGSPGSLCTWTGPWISPTVGFSVAVTPPANAAPGTYTFTCTVNLGCSFCPTIVSTKTISIGNLTAGPPLSVSVTPTVACVGDIVTMTVSGAAPGTAYVWSPLVQGITNLGGGVTHQVLTILTNNQIAPNVYTYSVSTSGCVGMGTGTYTLNPLPTFSVTPSQTICLGNQAVLTVTNASSPNLTYSWSPSIGLSTTTGSAVVATPGVSTSYFVTATDPVTLCTNTAVTTVFVAPPSPPITVSGQTSICIGQTTTLTASGANSYTWFPGGSTTNTLVVSPNVTTTYTVVGSGNTCNVSAVVTVTVNPPPTLTVTNYTICNGSSTTLTVTGASTYSWSPPTGLSSTSGSAVVASPTSSTTYTVTGTSSAGCIGTNTISVTVLPSPNPPVLGSQTICSTGATTYTASISVATGFPFTWSAPPTTGTLSCTNCSNPTVTVSATSVFTVTVTGNNGCTTMKTVTVSVNPTPTVTINSPSICPGATATLTASGATTYTWLPGNANGATHTVSPNNQMTYTVTGSTNGCSSTATATVYMNPIPPTFTWSPRPCSGTTSTVSIVSSQTTGVFYAWSPSVTCINIPCTTVALTPTAGVSYSVVATNSFGCTRTQTFLPLTSPGLTVSATPSVVCTGGNMTTVLTANTSSPSNAVVTWTSSPTATITCNNPICHFPVVNVTGTSVFTATATGSNGCQTVSTLTVVVNPTPTVTVNSATICVNTNTVLVASGANSYTWVPGGVNNSNTFTTTTYQNPGTFTVQVNGSNPPNACIGSATATITVLPSPNVTTTFSTLTVSPVCGQSPNPPGGNSVCLGSSAVLSANLAGATSYTWNPGNLVGQTVTVTPTTTGNTTYTVTASIGQCPGTGTIAVTALACPCTGGPPLPTGGNISGGTQTVNSNLTIPNTNTLTLTGVDVLIGTGLSITVNNGGVLNIINSHLYACSNMWQGIIVMPGGKVTMSNTAGFNNLIEDAIIGVDDNNNGTPNTTALRAIIDISGTVFNRNLTAIRKGFYQSTLSANYAATSFLIRDVVITSRCGITTSTTTGFLRTLISGGTPLPTITEFYQVANLTPTTLKAPNLGKPAFEGIFFQECGDKTSQTPSSTTYTVGQLTGGLVLFDNLVYGINAVNSNILVTNSAFQLPQRTGKLLTIGGYGINATNNSNLWFNGLYVNNSTFIEMARGIHNVNYYDFKLNTSTFISQQVAPNPGGFKPTINPAGDYGMFVKTPRFTQGEIKGNRFYNIDNCIDVVIDANGVYAGGNGQSVGPLFINGNFHDRQYPNDNIVTTYIGNGIIVDNVLMSPSSGPALGQTTAIRINQNDIRNAYRGILARNHKYQEVRDEDNTITLLFEPNDALGNASTQYGIYHDHVTYPLNPNGVGDDIHGNTITGFTTSFISPSLYRPKKGIWCSLTGNHYVTCNNVSNLGRGIEFSGINTPVVWRLNNMSSSGEGFILSSNSGGGVIGAQGQNNDASDNTWIGFSGGTNFQTQVDPGNSSFSSVLWVQNSAPYNPTINAGGAAAYQAGSLQYTGPATTFSNCATQTPPSMLVDHGSIINSSRETQDKVLLAKASEITLLELIALDSLVYMADISENSFINKNVLYRMIKQDTSLMDSSQILRNFFLANTNSAYSKFCEIEDSLLSQNFAYATALNGSLVPTCNIEQNYKRFYQMYINGMQGNFTLSDSSDLEILANSCPRLNGAVVYQARGFHNSYYNAFAHYEDNCPAITPEERGLGSAKVDLKLGSLFIFPNPGAGKIYIAGFNVLAKSTHIIITDVTGKMVYNKDNEVNSGITELTLSLQDGVYFIHLTDESGLVKVQKIIIQK